MRKERRQSKTGALAFLLVLCGTFGLVSARSAAATVVASPVDFVATEGVSFTGAVATCSDDRPNAMQSDIAATIDWGDGTTTAGSVFASSASFAVVGTHTYADEMSASVMTMCTDTVDTSTSSTTSTGTVTEGDSLSGTPVTFTALAGTSFTGTVANFTDTSATNPASDFMATIDWGDATTTAGAITGGGGSFAVSGTHTYAGAGTFSVIVTMADDAPGTATATVTSTAHVGAPAGLTAFPQTFAATEGVTFNGVVATFTDGRGGALPADFTASVDWGDGTTTIGTVASSGGGAFTVSGTHPYADEGTFSVPVQVTDNVAMTTANATSTANVAEGDALTPAPATFSASTGTPFSGVVATFTDTDTANVPADFVATIDWGDGTTTVGTVTGGGGTFSVSGTHTYSTAGAKTVTVTFTDDAPGTATATATSTANVTTPTALVPALDWRGMAALTLILAAAGLLLLRRADRLPDRGGQT